MPPRILSLPIPVYDIQKNTGTTSWSYPLINEIRRKQRDALFKRVSNRAGLYFFVSGACPYCKEQAKIVHWFSADYGWNVISVARDFCTPEYPNCMVNPDLFTVFRATYTPSLFLIYRRSDNKPAIFPGRKRPYRLPDLKEPDFLLSQAAGGRKKPDAENRIQSRKILGGFYYICSNKSRRQLC
ncbi:F plasmid transfer operon protein [Candidatus Methanoperedenaceae archaeon GB37]|nr:F plasmid transfer operon protein [Candidatus Methanoperedenaceae archaeon GB37]